MRLEDRQADDRRGVIMGVAELVYCTAVIVPLASTASGYGLESLSTLAFVSIVFGNQATTYTNRERRQPAVFLAEPLAPGLVRRRRPDRVDACRMRNRDGIDSPPHGGGPPCGGRGFRLRTGRCKGARA
jgi:hypothetical protein